MTISLQAQLGALPIVEVAKEIDIVGCGEPLAKPPTPEGGIILPAKVVVAIGIARDRARRGLNLTEFILIELVTIDQLPFNGFEPGVLLNNRETLFHLFAIFVLDYLLTNKDSNFLVTTAKRRQK
jgi:hypothetical protein